MQTGTKFSLTDREPRQLKNIARKAPRLRADEHPRTTPVGADVRVPHRLTGIIATRAGRVIIAISARSVIGRRRGDRGADDGAGRKPTKNSCAYGTANAMRLRRPGGAQGNDADRDGRGKSEQGFFHGASLYNGQKTVRLTLVLCPHGDIKAA